MVEEPTQTFEADHGRSLRYLSEVLKDYKTPLALLSKRRHTYHQVV